MTWWWLSFIDPDKPAGSKFLGVSIVEAPSFALAVTKAHATGCNPGGEVCGCAVKQPLQGDSDRLLDRVEAARLAGHDVH